MLVLDIQGVQPVSYVDDEYAKAVELRQQMRGTYRDAVRMARQNSEYCDCGCDEGRQARKEQAKELRGDAKCDEDRDNGN
jgi:hypothetical protein